MPIMKNTIDVLEALKAKTGAPSDYALHKILGVTRQAISTYRTNTSTFSDEMCLKVASILEVDPCLILAIAYAERTGNQEVKAAWKTVLERLSGMAAMLLIATGVNLATPSNGAASELVSSGASDIHYANNNI
jgi:predicted transcriptional regulator